MEVSSRLRPMNAEGTFFVMLYEVGVETRMLILGILLWAKAWH